MSDDDSGGFPPPPGPVDTRVLRAVRGLYFNTDLGEKVDKRRDKAAAELRAYLTQCGLSAVRIGMFQIQESAGRIEVTKAPPIGANQLALFERELADDLGRRTVLSSRPSARADGGPS